MKKIYQIKNKLEPVFSLTNFEIIECNTIDDLQKQTIYSDIWLINIDLNWDKELEYGLNIGVFIRKELKSCSPIIFYTSYTEKITTDYTSNQNYKYKLLQTPECYFFDKNNLVNEIEKIKSTTPISNLCLEDINYFVFDAKGRIDELCHDLRNDIKEELTDKNAILEEFKKNCIKEIESFNLLKFEQLFIEFKTNVFKNNQYDILINNLKTAIYLLLPKSDHDKIDSNKEVINWQVIYLEDDEHIAQEIKKGFEENGVICHTAANEDDVIDLLDKNDDFNNENVNNVTLFITDIRLKDKNGKWHKRQGYDVIEQIANHSKMPLAFAVLTSKKGSIINSAKQNLKYKIHWENKENVIHNKQAFNVYFNRLINLVTENNIYSFSPKASKWFSGNNINKFRFSHSEYYKFYKQLSYDKYNKLEEQINEKLEENKLPLQPTATLTKDIIDLNEIEKFSEKLLLRRYIIKEIFTSKLKNESAFEKINKNLCFESENTIKKFYSEFVCIERNEKKIINDIILFFEGINKNNCGILKEEYDYLISKKLIQNIIDSLTNKEYSELIKSTVSSDQVLKKIKNKVINSFFNILFN